MSDKVLTKDKVLKENEVLHDDKVLMKGNDVLAESAVRAGCRYYFGYPITPQNEVPEYMSARLPEVGGVFVQAESELASINMLLGAGACGVRAMTSSSSPGISLMQEGISYMAGSEIPGVLVNMVRGGPGLGNIAPSQADYLQSVKGGGHGDYKVITIAPSTVQELADLTYEAFDISIKYRNPLMILGDGVLGQMSEPVNLPPMKDAAELNDTPGWACGNKKEQVVIKSLRLAPDDALEKHNWHLQEKYRKIEAEFVRWEEYETADAEYLVCAYGTTARVCKYAVSMLRKEGIKIGLFRPITLYPFPKNQLKKAADKIKNILVFEMAYAQFEEDVKLTIEGKSPVKGFYKLGGAVFDDEEIIKTIKENLKV
jgi:2-oxoglutarate/2-oxoacid ferredoxin oxidoreductase subunit alpha